MKDRIKAIRQELKLTQTEFADVLGLSKNYISLLENGQRSLGEQSIKVLCANHGVNEEWLRTGAGDMFEPMEIEDEIRTWAVDVAKLSPDDPRFQILKMLAKLPQEDWKAVGDMIDILKENKNTPE